jgi:hypothetical protein
MTRHRRRSSGRAGLAELSRLALLALAALSFAGAVTGAASAGSPKLRITYITPTVSPGGTLTIKAVAPTGVRCNVSLLPSKSDRSTKLASRTFPSGRGSWSYRLPLNAVTGSWQVLAWCSKGGTVTASFKVGAAPVTPAQITVVKSGFSIEPLGSETFLHCGVQLQNTSTVSDARNLVVTVTFVDTQGRSLTTEAIDLTVIPAGQTFYASCLAISSVTLSVGSVQVHVKVRESVPKKAQLPIVSALALSADPFGDTQTLTGTITSPYAQAMPQDAAIYAVYYDANGNIIGGDWTPAGASIQPGATVGFTFPDLDPGIASAQVSVDPCGSAGLFGGCTVP